MKAINCHASNALWLLLQTITHSHPPWLMQTHILLCGRPQHTSGLTYWEWGFMMRIKMSKEFLISLVAQMVKHLQTMWETRVQSLGQEDPPEKEMATHYSTLAWKIPWTEEPGRLQSMGSQRVRHDWGTKITADGDCSHEIKRHLLLGRKAMTNLESLLKTRDIILPTKVHLVKAIVFPLVMYGCESWNIKKAEHQRIDAFELWCWRRLLRVPWTARRSNQSILKEISPEYSLEGLMLKLKL